MPKPTREEELLAQLETLVRAVADMGQELERITTWVDAKIEQEQRQALRDEIRAELQKESSVVVVVADFIAKRWRALATTGIGGTVTIWAAIGGYDGADNARLRKPPVIRRGVAPRADDRPRPKADRAGQKLHRAATPDAPPNER